MAQINLVTGPGKWDLMLALFDHIQANGDQRELEFGIANDGQAGPASCKVLLQGCSRSPSEDGKWSLTGRIWIYGSGHWTDFQGWFSTIRRDGQVWFSD